MKTLEMRYAAAIKKIGGTFALLALPEDVKLVLMGNYDLETKTKMLEKVAEAMPKKQERKPSMIGYEIVYEVPTASGNVHCSRTVVYGLGKLDMMALCKLHNYKIIEIEKWKVY